MISLIEVTLATIEFPEPHPSTLKPGKTATVYLDCDYFP